MQIADVVNPFRSKKESVRNEPKDRLERGEVVGVTLATLTPKTRKIQSFRQFNTDVSHSKPKGWFCGSVASRSTCFIYTLRTRWV